MFAAICLTMRIFLRKCYKFLIQALFVYEALARWRIYDVGLRYRAKYMFNNIFWTLFEMEFKKLIKTFFFLKYFKAFQLLMDRKSLKFWKLEKQISTMIKSGGKGSKNLNFFRPLFLFQEFFLLKICFNKVR